MKPYIIRQGDYLLKVSHLLGFDPDKVWNDPKNADLKASRKDPTMLKPGDILFVPDEPKKRLSLNAKQANVYVARVPSVKVSVVVAADGAPLKNEKYVVEGLGDDETELTTDGNGAVSFEAPVHAREVVVRFVNRKTHLQVAIGDLDPPDTPSGARMRLTSLGYYSAKLTGADQYVSHDEGALAGAVRSFQAANGIDPTGDIDSATKDALVLAHGS
jgi:Putative peptidoglycan binding domain